MLAKDVRKLAGKAGLRPKLSPLRQFVETRPGAQSHSHPAKLALQVALAAHVTARLIRAESSPEIAQALGSRAQKAANPIQVRSRDEDETHRGRRYFRQNPPVHRILRPIFCLEQAEQRHPTLMR